MKNADSTKLDLSIFFTTSPIFSRRLGGMGWESRNSQLVTSWVAQKCMVYPHLAKRAKSRLPLKKSRRFPAAKNGAGIRFGVLK